MLGPIEVKSVLKEYNIRPNKRLGQNFLIDKNIQKKIITAAGVRKEDTVFEIGPGLGALTGELCKTARKVIAIEKDRRAYNFLLKNFTISNLELIHGDVLKYDFSNHRKIKVVGNLPYYISTPILTHLLNNRNFIRTILITVQKELAERLIAKAGARHCGRVSYFLQFYAEPDFLFTIKKRAFYPVPQVDSCFLKIRVRDKECYLTDEKKLFKIIKACFNKRRKMILNSLYSSGEFTSREEVLERLKIAGISPAQRPEEISLEQFVKLTETV